MRTVEFTASQHQPGVRRGRSILLAGALLVFLLAAGPAAAQPDLVVEDGYPTLSTTTVNAGGTLDVTLRIKNQGDAISSDPFRDHIYLSTDNVLDAGDVFLRDSILHNVPINPGSRTGASTREVTIPTDTVSGSYFILLEADGTQSVAESDETNNVASAGPVSITGIAVGPDVIIDDFSIQNTVALAGGKITAAWSVRNIGNEVATGTFRDFVYLSTDGVLDAGDTQIGTSVEHNVPINPGSRTGIGTREIDVPAGIAPGDYVLLVEADGTGAITEIDEANNVLAAANVNIRVAGQDLVVENVQLSTSSIGTRHTVTVTYDVVNIGIDDVTVDFEEVIALSLDTVHDASDLDLRRSVTHQGIASGQRLPQTREVVIPDGIALGNYYIVVLTDVDLVVTEPDEVFNNTGFAALNVFEGVGDPDLVPTNLALASSTVPQGNTVEVTWTLLNQGTAATVTDFRDQLILSADTVYDEGVDTFLRNSVRHTFRIPENGGTLGSSREVVIPGDATPGQQYILVFLDGEQDVQTLQILDNVVELDETNNIAAIPVTIEANSGDVDMSIGNLHLSTDMVGATFGVTVSYNVVNNGTVAQEERWKDGIYLSDDATLDAGDILLGQSHLHSFRIPENGGIHPHSQEVTIPAGTPVGPKYILVQADDETAVTETDETNNVTAVPLTTYAEGFDFVVSALSVSSTTVITAEAFTLDHTVMNQGVDLVTDSWRDAIWLSSDDVLDVNDVLLRQSHRHTIDVPGFGGTHGHGRDVTIPSTVAAGDYYILVEADGLDEIVESNETNNLASIMVTVEAGLGLPDLVIGNPVLGSSSVKAAESVVVSYDETNQGAIDVTMDHWNRFYLSTDATLQESTDVLLHHSDRIETDILAGTSLADSREVPIPSDTVPGSYFVIVKADGLGLVEETSEGNNTAAVAVTVTAGDGIADLVVENVVVPDVFGLVGRSLTFDYNVVNQGTAQVTMPNQDSFFLSTNASLDALDSDRGLSQVYHDDIAANGGFDPRTQQIFIPDDVIPGNYFLLVRTDDVDTEEEIPRVGFNVEESDETNNVTSVPLAIWTDGADLVIDNLQVPTTSVSLGSDVQFSYRHLNQGSIDVTNEFFDGIYLSNDEVLDATDVLLLVTHMQEPNITAFGGTFEQGRTVTIPLETEPGDYFILIVADEEALVTEGNEDNNFSAAPLTVVE